MFATHHVGNRIARKMRGAQCLRNRFIDRIGPVRVASDVEDPGHRGAVGDDDPRFDMGRRKHDAQTMHFFERSKRRAFVLDAVLRADDGK